MDHLAKILQRFPDAKHSGQNWSAKCPAHDDRCASLSIKAGDDGRVLLKCHANCTSEDICRAVGLKLADLFPPSNGNANGRPKPSITKVYDYMDRDGEVRHQTVRMYPKSFRQRRPDGNGGYIWNLQGVETILYRLPDLIDAPTDDWVFVVEGEKDVDRGWAEGIVATCNPMGAGKWKASYSETLRGRKVVIIPDRDEPGEAHAKTVKRSLAGIAAEARIIRLPEGAGKDLSDYFDGGGTKEKIIALVEASAANDPEPETGSDTPTPDAEADQETLEPIDLIDLWDRHPHLNQPIIDGLLRRGQVGNLVSTSKAYKTYLILSLAMSMVQGKQWLERFPCTPGRVLLVDLELQSPDIVHRTKDIAAAMHCAADEIREMIQVIPLRGKVGNINKIERMLSTYEPRHFSLIVIDPLYKTYPDPFDENNNAQMTLLYQRFERLAEKLECAILIVHHGTKGNQSEKRVVDVGSGASAQSRSADAHIAIREHEVEGAVVFDARVRSFPPIDPLCLRWEYPLWHRALDLNPENLATAGKKRKDTPDPSGPPEAAAWTVERFVESLIKPDPLSKQVILARAKAVHDLSSTRAGGFLAVAEADRLIFRWTFPSDNKAYFATVEQPVTATKQQEK